MSKKAMSFLLTILLTTLVFCSSLSVAAGAVTEPPTAAATEGTLTAAADSSAPSEPVSTEPETTVSAAQYPVLTVSAISNYFGRIDAEYNEFTRQITVVYMMKANRRLLSVDWTLSYDAQLLSVDHEKNTRETICPVMQESSVIGIDDEEGVIRFSATSLQMYDFSTDAKPIVKIIFDVPALSPEDSEITKVDLSVNDLLVSEPDPATGEALPTRETVLVANGKVLKDSSVKTVQVSKYTTITPSTFFEPLPGTADELVTLAEPTTQEPTPFIKPTSPTNPQDPTRTKQATPLLYTGTWYIALAILLLLMVCSTVLLILRKRDIYDS